MLGPLPAATNVNCVVTRQAPKPTLKPKDVRIGVTYTAANRAEVMQRQGSYPPPPGASELLGLECAGKVIEVSTLQILADLDSPAILQGSTLQRRVWLFVCSSHPGKALNPYRAGAYAGLAVGT